MEVTNANGQLVDGGVNVNHGETNSISFISYETMNECTYKRATNAPLNRNHSNNRTDSDDKPATHIQGNSTGTELSTQSARPTHSSVPVETSYLRQPSGRMDSGFQASNRRVEGRATRQPSMEYISLHQEMYNRTKLSSSVRSNAALAKNETAFGLTPRRKHRRSTVTRYIQVSLEEPAVHDSTRSSPVPQDGASEMESTSGGELEGWTEHSINVPVPVKNDILDDPTLKNVRGASFASRRSTAASNYVFHYLYPTKPAKAKTEKSKRSKKMEEKRKTHLQLRKAHMKTIYKGWQFWWRKQQVKRVKFLAFETQIRLVESRFGSGVGSFFAFIEWIFLLNLGFALIWTTFVALPQIVDFDYGKINGKFHVRQMLLGGGALEESWLFYGGYSNTLTSGYPLAIIYLCCVYLTYFGGFLIVLKSIAHNLGEEYVGDIHYKFSLLTFGTWDYAMTLDRNHQCIFLVNAFRDVLHEIDVEKEIKSQSKENKLKLFLLRFGAWLITVILITIACVLIFSVISADLVSVFRDWGYDLSRDHIIVTSTPTVVFIVVNLTIPLGIYYLPEFENYQSGRLEVYITTFRIYILRTLNVIALMVSYRQRMRNGYFEGCTGSLLGQEFYKLVVSDSVVGISSVILPNTFLYFLNNEPIEFYIPSQILILLYRLDLIWLSTLFCPLMPLIGVVSILLFFWSCYILVIGTGRPPEKRWNQPRQSTFFMGLTAANLLVIIALASVLTSTDELVVLGEVRHKPNATSPSIVTDEICGPFNSANGTAIFDAWRNTIRDADKNFSRVFEFLISGTVIIPGAFLTMAVLYYQHLRFTLEKHRTKQAQDELNQERNNNRIALREKHLAKLALEHTLPG